MFAYGNLQLKHSLNMVQYLFFSEVLAHLEKVRDEREIAKAETDKAEKEKRRRKAEKKAEGGESDQSADSIIEDVIEMIKDKKKEVSHKI